MSAPKPARPGQFTSTVPGRPDWRPRRWAVIGGSGFVGSAIVSRLMERSFEVKAVPAPRLVLPPNEDDGLAVAKVAAGSNEISRLAAELAGFDVVVNAAGLAEPDGSESSSILGANGLLPAVVVYAATMAGATRVIHISSAAVQGEKHILDSTPYVDPFSPYSRSKALGERAFLAVEPRNLSGEVDKIVVRATSVQGKGRKTTTTLQRVARSPFSSVASPGDRPTIVSSVTGLAEFVISVGVKTSAQPAIQLQPWEGLTTREVLKLAGGREPRVLPAELCRYAVRCGKFAGRFSPKAAGLARRIEVMWFGQMQEGQDSPPVDQTWVVQALAYKSAGSDVAHG